MKGWDGSYGPRGKMTMPTKRGGRNGAEVLGLRREYERGTRGTPKGEEQRAL